MHQAKKPLTHIILEGAENREFLPPSFDAHRRACMICGCYVMFVSTNIFAIICLNGSWAISY